MQTDVVTNRLAGAIGAPDDPRALLDLIIGRSPVGIAVFDREGRFLEANPAYCALYGYRLDQLLGQPFTMVFASAQHDELQRRHRAFLDDGAPLQGEFEVLRADGQVAAVLALSVRLAGGDGQPRRLAYVVDITERRHIELALQRSQQFLQAVLDGLAAHVCVLDERGTILAVNRSWREFAEANGAPGQAPHEGASYVEVCERAARSARPDGAEAGDFVALLREVLAGRRQGFELEYPCHSPDEQRWFVARVSCMAGQRPPRFVVAHDNVTALKQAQATLRRSEALLVDVAASLPGVMFRLVQNAEGRWRFTYFSPGIEALFGLTAADACSDVRALGNCILPEDRPAHDRAIEQAVAARRGLEQEYRIRSRDGALRWVHARADSPKPGDDGEMVWTGMLTDVSERKRMEAVLRAGETQYRTLFETVPQGVVYLDNQGRITSANPAAQRILGLSLAQLLGMGADDPHWQSVREDGGTMPVEEHPSVVTLRTGAPVRDAMMGVSVPGRGLVWLLINTTPLCRDGALEQVYATFEDVTERVQLTHELRMQASTDFLTGVANRRRLMERLQVEVERVQRHPSSHCAVLSIDLDHFKQVNDSRGHAAGDAVLRHVAQLMQQATRLVDLVARSGGEEFTLLLPDTGTDDALALAERLRARIAEQPVWLGGRPLPQTVSIGVGAIRAGDGGPDPVLARADTALYAAKAAGRNTVRLAPDLD